MCLKRLLQRLKGTLPTGIRVRTCLRQENRNKREIDFCYILPLGLLPSMNWPVKTENVNGTFLFLLIRLETTIIQKKKKESPSLHLMLTFCSVEFKESSVQYTWQWLTLWRLKKQGINKENQSPEHDVHS